MQTDLISRGGGDRTGSSGTRCGTEGGACDDVRASAL